MSPGIKIRARQLARDLTDPVYLGQRVRRFVDKRVRKMRGTDQRVVSLPPHGDSEERGRVLLSYILEPFLLGDPDRLPHSHTHFWETWTIADTWRRHGFAVDAVSWQNRSWVPSKRYDVVIDVRCNLERWAPRLGDGTLKILHADTAHHSFHNPAQHARLDALEARRGVRIAPNKLVEENEALRHADVVVILGNDFTRETYEAAVPNGAQPPEFVHVPVSVPFAYDWADEDLASKDWDQAKKRFLWFGSGGLVHKGLDLVLEAFAGLPDFHLTVCGPIRGEPDFERVYWDELYDMPNIHSHGWVDAGGADFRRLASTTGFLIYPSCSEGGGSSVYTCMHAGLVPILDREASVDLDPADSIALDDVTVDGIRDLARATSNLDAEMLASKATSALEAARLGHTKERFEQAYDGLVEHLVADRLSDSGGVV